MKIKILTLVLVLAYGTVFAGVTDKHKGVLARINASTAISLNTGHSLGDMVACYILVDSTTTGTGTSVLDLTSNDYDLTLSEDSATGYTREVGGGVTFVTAGEGKAAGSHAPITAYEFTLVIHIKTPAGTDAMYALGLQDASEQRDVASVGTGTDTTYRTNQIIKDSAWYQSFGSTLSTSTEYVMAAVYTGASDRELFLDGSSDSTDTDTTTFAFNILDTICLGAHCDLSPQYGNGTIYAAYIYDRALSDADAESITDDPYQMINNYSGP